MQKVMLAEKDAGREVCREKEGRSTAVKLNWGFWEIVPHDKGMQ